MKRVMTWSVFAAAIGCLGIGPAHAVVTFDWATVGDPGNADDTRGDGYGGVDYEFRISKHEVTNSQYVEFLNAVAASGDPHGLYHLSDGFAPSQAGIVRTENAGIYSYAVKPDENYDDGTYTYGNKPVNWVDTLDMARFANWLHNGQGNVSTETGAYTITENTTASNLTRNPGAKAFIPNEDEWYKAAYYQGDGSYHRYATGSGAPDGVTPPNDTGNSANYLSATGDTNYPFTQVGAYADSASHYGTFDQNGNISELTEEGVNRGGHHAATGTFGLRADDRLTSSNFEAKTTGFRVAMIPEPASLALLAIGGAIMLPRRPRCPRR